MPQKPSNPSIGTRITVFMVVLVGLFVAAGYGYTMQQTPDSIVVAQTTMALTPPDPKPVLAGPTVFGLPAPARLGIVFEIKTLAVVYVEPGSVAEQAGIVVGDRVLAWNGSPIGDLSDQSQFNQIKNDIWLASQAAARGTAASMLIERDGEQLELAVLPKSAPPSKPAGWDDAQGRPPTATPVLSPYVYL